MKTKLILIFLLTSVVLKLEGQVLYVDSSAGPNGNGANWNNAFTELSAALDSAWKNPSIDEIRVAAGTYQPSSFPFEMNSSQVGSQIANLTQEYKTFHIRTGLELLGGYPSGGGVRDPNTHVVKLSAQYYDSLLIATSSRLHVLILDSSNHWSSSNDTTVLDGFQIVESNKLPVNMLLDSLLVNSKYIRNRNGRAINITSGTHALKNNSFRNNKGSFYYDEFIYGKNSYLEITSNTIDDNDSILNLIIIDSCVVDLEMNKVTNTGPDATVSFNHSAVRSINNNYILPTTSSTTPFATLYHSVRNGSFFSRFDTLDAERINYTGSYADFNSTQINYNAINFGVFVLSQSDVYIDSSTFYIEKFGTNYGNTVIKNSQFEYCIQPSPISFQPELRFLDNQTRLESNSVKHVVYSRNIRFDTSVFIGNHFYDFMWLEDKSYVLDSNITDGTVQVEDAPYFQLTNGTLFGGATCDMCQQANYKNNNSNNGSFYISYGDSLNIYSNTFSGGGKISVNSYYWISAIKNNINQANSTGLSVSGSGGGIIDSNVVNSCYRGVGLVGTFNSFSNNEIIGSQNTGVYIKGTIDSIYNNDMIGNQDRGMELKNLSITKGIFNNVFLSNASNKNGGGLYIDDCNDLKIINNVFAENSSDSAGGGIFIRQINQPTPISCDIINNTFYKNTSDNNGAAFCVNDVSVDTGQFINNICIQNNTQNSSIEELSLKNSGNNWCLKYNILQGDSAADYRNQGSYYLNCIDSNLYHPQHNNAVFSNPSDIKGADNTIRTLDDGLRLLTNGHGTDIGNNNALPAYLIYDITGGPRIQNSIVNLGAYENTGPAPIGIRHTDNSNKLLIYPNPSSDLITIDLKNIYSQGIDVFNYELKTIEGKNMITGNQKTLINGLGHILLKSELVGFYLLHVYYNGKTFSKVITINNK